MGVRASPRAGLRTRRYDLPRHRRGPRVDDGPSSPHRTGDLVRSGTIRRGPASGSRSRTSRSLRCSERVAVSCIILVTPLGEQPLAGARCAQTSIVQGHTRGDRSSAQLLVTTPIAGTNTVAARTDTGRKFISGADSVLDSGMGRRPKRYVSFATHPEDLADEAYPRYSRCLVDARSERRRGESLDDSLATLLDPHFLEEAEVTS